MLVAIILVETVVPVNQDLPRSDIDVFANQVGRVTTVHMVGYNPRGVFMDRTCRCIFYFIYYFILHLPHRINITERKGNIYILCVLNRK